MLSLRYASSAGAMHIQAGCCVTSPNLAFWSKGILWIHRGGAGVRNISFRNSKFWQNIVGHSIKHKPITPLYLQAEKYLDRVALVDQHGIHLYKDIVRQSERLSDRISSACDYGNDDIQCSRVAFLCPNDVSYVVAQWATWMTGGVCVPLCKSHPRRELEYFVTNSESTVLIATEQYAETVGPIADKLGRKMLLLEREDYLPQPCSDDIRSSHHSELVEAKQHDRKQKLHKLVESNHFKNMPALIIYTSGTTGRPKGVVLTHGNVQAQMDDMVCAWGWTSRDVILHVLPLHHVHGVVNALMTPLFCGATCVMMPEFDAKKVWEMLLSPATDSLPRRINLFMAVPTIYSKLIEDHKKRVKSESLDQFVKNVTKDKIRLMVSGSAALPEPIMKTWEDITGHQLLERYGMTEFGMALTNPLEGKRIPGTVGVPFPQVSVRIARDNVYVERGYDILAEGTAQGTEVTKGCEGEPGELLVRGPNVFTQYWNNIEATQKTFTRDDWFKTGDTACYRDGAYKILGRTEVDVIRNGAFKVSALDIECQLLSHPAIREVAVVGLPDVVWGQKVAAVLILQPGTTLELWELQQWALNRLTEYQLPSVIEIVDELPYNSFGVINKKELSDSMVSKLQRQASSRGGEQVPKNQIQQCNGNDRESLVAQAVAPQSRMEKFVSTVDEEHDWPVAGVESVLEHTGVLGHIENQTLALSAEARTEMEDMHSEFSQSDACALINKVLKRHKVRAFFIVKNLELSEGSHGSSKSLVRKLLCDYLGVKHHKFKLNKIGTHTNGVIILVKMKNYQDKLDVFEKLHYTAILPFPFQRIQVEHFFIHEDLVLWQAIRLKAWHMTQNDPESLWVYDVHGWPGNWSIVAKPSCHIVTPGKLFHVHDTPSSSSISKNDQSLIEIGKLVVSELTPVGSKASSHKLQIKNIWNIKKRKEKKKNLTTVFEIDSSGQGDPACEYIHEITTFRK